MALSSTIVWEVRSAGNANNGGGYKTGASGTDYSQQNSAQYALTGLASAGSGNVVLSTAAAADMVGNVAQCISGTNFNAGFYEVTSVSVGVSITFGTNGATSICSGVGASGVVNIGGALLTLGSIGSATTGAVAGNLICVKADGAYTVAATDTLAFSGTSTSPIRIIGYKTTRPTATTDGDGYLGRTNGNGALITTNLPALTYNSTFQLNATGSFLIVENLNIAGSRSAPVATITTDSLIRGCAFTNSSTNAAAAGLIINTRCLALDCDAFLTGASGGAAAFTTSTGTAGVRFFGCRGKTTSTTAAAFTTSTSGAPIFESCTAYASGIGILINSSNTGWAGSITRCTIVGNTSDGIQTPTLTTQVVIGDNMITDNGGYGINLNAAGSSAVLFNNRTRDNTLGAINGGTNYVNATNYGAVTTDTGGPETDYVNSGGNDYNLIAGSPAVSVALPLYSSMGALQRSQTGGGVCHLAGDGGGFVG